MTDEAIAPVTAALLGLDGFAVLAAADAGGEPELLVQTTAGLVGCPGCGAVARAKDRRPTWVRDLPVGGRPVVICWHKRIWCCPPARCEAKTWTETHPAIAPRAALTERGSGPLSRSAATTRAATTPNRATTTSGSRGSRCRSAPAVTWLGGAWAAVSGVVHLGATEWNGQRRSR